MGFMRRTVAPAPKRRGYTEVDAAQGGFLRSILAGWGMSGSGLVTPDSALGLPAVWACIRVLADDISSLPLPVYQRKAGGGRVRAYWEPAYRLLHDRPNTMMTPADLLSTTLLHLNTHGNAYWGKERHGRIITNLWPIQPDRVEPAIVDGRVVYRVREGGEIKVYSSDAILHFKGMSQDGIKGLSPITVQRRAIAMGITLDEYAQSLFDNRGVPAGVIKAKGQITKQKADELRDRWEANYRGTANAGRVAILPEDAEFEAIALPLADAQYVELSKLSIAQSARIFRVPASMVGASTGDSLTYKTVEGDALHYLRHSLRPWVTRIEQTINADADLCPPAAKIYSEFLVDAFLRADTKTRYEAYQLAAGGAPWMGTDEIRDLENLAADDRFTGVAPAPAVPAPAPAAKPAE